MNLRFEIKNLPPMPRNRSHRVAGKMLIKTDLARAFEQDLTKRLEVHRDIFRVFKSMVHLDQHYLSVVYRIHTPAGSLFTKDGHISLRAVDVDAHKVFQDVIFKSLGLDDKLIRDAQYITPVSEDENWNYIVEIRIRDIRELHGSDLL